MTMTTPLKDHEMHNLFLMAQFVEDIIYILHRNSLQRAWHMFFVLRVLCCVSECIDRRVQQSEERKKVYVTEDKE